jgi:hypothetical protein
MIAIGVDPGAHGAMVALCGDKSVFFCMDNGNLDSENLRLIPGCKFDIGIVAIECQQYMAKGGRQQGAKSAFSLGCGFGFWRGYFRAFDADIIEPWPREWQRYFFGAGTVISNPKERSIREARRRLPDLELVPPRCRVPSHGRADAGLIALWGLERIKEQG